MTLLDVSRSSVPASEVLATSEAKSFLRVDHSDEDTLIASMISTARERCEEWCRRAFVSTPLVASYDDLPRRDHNIELPRPRYLSGLAVKYTDTDGGEQTFAASGYSLHAHGDIAVVHFSSLPTVGDYPAPLRLEYTAGYGGAATDVPEAIRHAVLLVVSHLYEVRGSAERLPAGVQSLLSPYRRVLS